MASSSSNSPCAACKFLRRKCTQGCVFAPYFPPDQPQKFANVHRVFGASNVSKLLQELPQTQREDTVNSLAYEAEARLRDPVYGCVGYISLLQQKLRLIQNDLLLAKKELASYVSTTQTQIPYAYYGLGLGQAPMPQQQQQMLVEAQMVRQQEMWRYEQQEEMGRFGGFEGQVVGYHEHVGEGGGGGEGVGLALVPFDSLFSIQQPQQQQQQQEEQQQRESERRLPTVAERAGSCEEVRSAAPPSC
ncbi:LOB domain-containing protein 6 [Acorus calamus]|uniref:LOB domain-containing protein 6 n=1 Tax=Acorus calamus TaxID=4465 RepID=A0AAV9DIW5_ACOCL|nr:LOB domain-containing protein 6 [Acorus calamus]